MKEIAPKFLRIVYEITTNETSGIVQLDQVAERIPPEELGVTGSEYTDALSRVAMYLGNKGLLNRQSADWGMFTITSKGIDEAEGTNQPAVSSPTFHFYGPVTHSIVGTQTNAELTNNFDFGEFDRDIEENGGADKAELYELRKQLRQLLEDKDSIKRGYWARFAGVIQRNNSWILKHIGQATAGYLTQQLGT